MPGACNASTHAVSWRLQLSNSVCVRLRSILAGCTLGDLDSPRFRRAAVTDKVRRLHQLDPLAGKSLRDQGITHDVRALGSELVVAFPCASAVCITGHHHRSLGVFECRRDGLDGAVRALI